MSQEPYHRLVQSFRDVAVGSCLLACHIRTGVRDLHRAAGQLPAAAAAKGKSAKPASSTPEADAHGEPIPESSDAVPEEAAPTGRSRSRRRAQAWTLDRLAGTAFLGWIGWCFLHRPVVSGLRALVPDLIGISPWAVGLWIAAAWLVAQREKIREAKQGPADRGPDDESEMQGVPSLGDVLAAERWLRHLVLAKVAEAVTNGRRGILLKTLLTEPGIPDGWTVTTLREHCERLEIPVRTMQVRGEGGGPTHGVHIHDLEHALGMPLADALTRYENPSTEAPVEGPLEPAGGAAGEGPSRAPMGTLVDRFFGAVRTRPSSPASTPLPSPPPPSPGRG